MIVDTSKAHSHENFELTGEGAKPQGNASPITETKPPVNIGQQPPEGNQAVSTEEVDLKTTFLDWAKETGFNIANDSIPDIKDENELKGLVSKTYAVEYAKNVDPFIADLLEKGIGLNDYQSQVQPLQEIINQSSDDMYTYVQYEREVEELTRLGKLTEQSTEDDYRAVWDKIADSTKSKMEGLSDEEKERLVSPYREKFKNDLNELTSGWKDKQQKAVKQKQEAYETQYKGELENLASKVDKMYAENKFNTPFGQPDKESFKDFIQQQLGISDIEIEKDGSKSTVRGIPFMHKLNADDDFLLKVLTAVYQADKGAIADVVNDKVSQVIGGLRLTPLSKGGTPAKPQRQSNLVDTSKPHTVS